MTSELIRRGRRETLNCLGGISLVERKLCAEGWKEVKLLDCGFREPLSQIGGQRLRLLVVSRIRQSERSAVLHPLVSRRALHFHSRAASRFICIAEQGFPQARPREVRCGGFLFVC